MALESLQKERIKKLENIKRLGIDPFPAKSNRKQSIFAARKMMGKKVVVAGRIRSLRPHGKIAFSDIEDESGKIQLLFRQNILNGEKYDFLQNLDLGDFIETSGEVIKTQAGEITIDVSDFNILTKSLRPLPSSWYGLKDVEERYRKRYVDLLMNSEVKGIFEKRSKIINALRSFLINQKGYFEVENPVLQPIYGGTRARPFKTHHNSLDMDLYLRISNELYLKKLIVGGFEKVFEIGHTFRNEGMDRMHNPEFTMLETMEAYANYEDNMNLIEEMFEYVANEVFGKTKLSYTGKIIDYKRPWTRVSLTELFRKHTGVHLHEIDTLEKATELAKKLGVEIKDYMTDGEILLEIFEKKCTDQLIQPTFVYDYPADFYPLAKRKIDNPKLVESFDIYVAGMEMGTNYSEQNDPQELREAWLGEKKKEKKGNQEAQQLDEDFLQALEYGMPPTSGIGPGLDRWVMVMTDSASLSEVIPFPMLKAEKKGKKEEISVPVEVGSEQDFSKKMVAVVNNEVELWKAMNALGHVTAFMGNKMTEAFDTGEYFVTKDGAKFPRNSQYPVVALVASGKELQGLVQKVRESGLLYLAYLPEMVVTSNDRKLEKMIASKEEKDVTYLGIGIFGENKEVDTLTKGFKLFQ